MLFFAVLFAFSRWVRVVGVFLWAGLALLGG